MKHVLKIAAALLVSVNPGELDAQDTTPNKGVFRIATFNVSFNRPKQGQLATDLANNSQQAVKVARIIRVIQPDILLLNEFDFDSQQESLVTFQRRYLENEVHNTSLAKAVYPHVYTNTVNTGVPSGLDLNRDGKTEGVADGFGFGLFPGQYGMVVLSKYPILKEQIRTFQNLLWSDIPNAAAPVTETGEPWYPQATWKKLRISSKSHWDIPIDVNGRVIHVLASHPTPPAFDGPEDRNGKRNHDEIRVWAEYLSDESAQWLVDDKGQQGGLPDSASFVIVGDLNADPVDGNSHRKAIRQLLDHPKVNAQFTPRSEGGVRAAETQKQANLKHNGKPECDTADFSDRAVGNLQVDYVLPSRQLSVTLGAVVWPVAGEPLFDAIDCTDHRMVWLDVTWRSGR